MKCQLPARQPQQQVLPQATIELKSMNTSKHSLALKVFLFASRRYSLNSREEQGLPISYSSKQGVGLKIYLFLVWKSARRS